MSIKRTKLPKGVRGIIYSFFTVQDLIDHISKLSKQDRVFLQNNNILDWRPENKEFKTKLEELSYLKKIVLNLNTKNKQQNITFEKLQFFINISHVIILAIDYSTVDNV